MVKANKPQITSIPTKSPARCGPIRLHHGQRAVLYCYPPAVPLQFTTASKLGYP